MFSTKSLIYTLSFCLIFFASCKTDSSNNTKEAATSPAETVTKPAAEESVHVPSSDTAPLVGFWHYQDVIHIDKKMVAKYDGRWIELKRDDTFISGIYLDENNSGTWSYDEAAKILRLMPKEKEDIATEWGINRNGEFLLWLGNTPGNSSGMQIRMNLVMDKSRPAK